MRLIGKLGIKSKAWPKPKRKFVAAAGAHDVPISLIAEIELLVDVARALNGRRRNV